MALTKVSRNLLATSIVDNGNATAITIDSNENVQFSGTISATGYNPTTWDTAYSWGNHASQSYATQSYVNTQVANLVDSAPSTLDTLNELASALGDDANFSTTVTNSIGTKWTQDNTKISAWDTAYSWGNHASAGYLTSHQDISGKLDTSGGTLTGNLTVPTLYINDTNTRISEGSSDSIRLTTDDGYVDIGPMNSGYCHIQTDRTNFYFDRPIHADGQIYNYAGGGTTQPYWHAGNDGSGSGLDADLLDGYNSAESGVSTIHRLASNGYSQIQNWINVANAGLYSSTQNGSHWRPNATGSYGAWRIDGSRGGYSGIYHGNGGGAISGMFDSAGNGGDWNVTSGWHYYYHRGNDCLAISGSTTSSAFSAYVHGDLYATGNVTAYSDARIKENVETIDSALDKVESMRGVYYNKIDDPKTKEIGFIAQEVNQVLPEAVTYARDVDQYGVKYANITALLVESVKELSQQVKDLQAEVKELKENV